MLAIKSITMCFFRFCEKSERIFFILSIICFLCAVFKDTINLAFNIDIGLWRLLVAGLISFTPKAIQLFKLWKFLPPTYRGLGDLHRYIRKDKNFAKSWFNMSGGQLQIDIYDLLISMNDILDRVVFIGGDETLNHIGAEINSSAFSGARYGTGFENKKKRNRSLSKHYFVKNTKQRFFS